MRACVCARARARPRFACGLTGSPEEPAHDRPRPREGPRGAQGAGARGGSGGEGPGGARRARTRGVGAGAALVFSRGAGGAGGLAGLALVLPRKAGRARARPAAPAVGARWARRAGREAAGGGVGAGAAREAAAREEARSPLVEGEDLVESRRSTQRRDHIEITTQRRIDITYSAPHCQPM